MQKLPRLVYIIGTYPGLTTTFIDREIKMLRQLGGNLQIIAIRQPTASTPFSAEQRDLQQGVIYLLPVNWLNFIVGHLYFILLHPLIYFNTLFYLLTNPHPNPRARVMTLLHFAEGVYAAYLLHNKAFDHLHAHFIDRAAVVALIISRLLNVPYSLTAHANDIYVKPVLLRAKIAGARFITTCTAYNQAYLLQAMGEELNNKLHLAYHGIDSARYQPSLSPFQRDRPLVLSIGRLTEKKGFSHLIAACRCLRDQGYQFDCQIVGTGPLQQELETLIVQLELEDTITLCGAIPHETVIEKYKQATLFVLPCIIAQDGDRDGIPNVLIEAMAMELPVVSSRHSGIPELIKDRVSGLLIPPGDQDALVKTLAELLSNPDLCTQLGEVGRQTVLRDFDVEQNVYRLFELFVHSWEDRK